MRTFLIALGCFLCLGAIMTVGAALADPAGTPRSRSALPVPAGLANTSGTNTGDVSLAAVGSSPSANGASLSGQVLTLQPASATQPGLMTTGTQTIAGAKTFSGAFVASGDFNLGSGCFSDSAGAVTLGCSTTAGTNVTITMGTNGHVSLGTDASLKVASGRVLFMSGSGDVTIASGFGTSPSITSSSTAAFTITVGSSPAGVGAITLQSNANGYSCQCQNVTSADSLVVGLTASSATSCSFKSYSRTTGLAANFNASDVLKCTAFGD